MKPLSCAIISLVLCTFLFTGTVFAEPTHPNEVGLYLTPHGYGATGTYENGLPVDVYLVLTKPTDTETGLPFSAINFFECQLNFSPFPINALFKLGELFPGSAVNVGNSWNLQEGYLEYIVGFAESIPVIDEAVVLVTITFFLQGTGEIGVTLGPTSSSSIPGQMDFGLGFQSPHIMHPVSGSHDAPVFLFNGEAVSVENDTFGSVKALYR